MKTQVFVYNTVTAAGGDLQTSSNMITLLNSTNSVSWMPKRGLLQSKGRVPAVAGTLQVSTGTITAASGATYRIKIVATNKITGNINDFFYTYVSDASATTAEIAIGLAAAVNADSNRVSVTAAESAGTLVLTGVAPYYTFSVENDNASSTTIAFALTTPGVISQGQGSVIINNNYIQGSDLESQINTTYAYTEFNFIVEVLTVEQDKVRLVPQPVVVYVYESASNYASFAGVDGTLTKAVRGGVVAAGGNAAVANGVITLGGSDIFYGNSDTNIGLTVGDIITINAVDYPIIAILSGTTAATNGTPNDQSAATTTYKQMVHT